jgi:IS30 family transposase
MSYTHLTSPRRGQIEVLRRAGWTYTAIAAEVGCHRTTISREIARNSTSSGYRGDKAHERYVERRKACRPKSRLAYEPLREYAIEKIAVERWSPEQVAGRVKVDFPGNPLMRVCHETLYKSIYTGRHFLDFLIDSLAQARKKRRKRGQGKTRRGPSITGRVPISERPAAVEQREELGHWEGDLIVSRRQDSFLITLVERASRLVQAVKVLTRKSSEVCQAIVEALLDFPTSWIKTITFDNGTEFSAHASIQKLLGAHIYFADPYCAYQRGSNENVNGLIRRYLPKGKSFKELSDDDLNAIINALNNRPRKCLGFRTPLEVFNQQRQQHLRALRA